MDAIIFYSWQSDLPNSLNRSFIQTALENAARTIRKDQSILVEPVVDRDTSGVPGAPDIANTIFEKIDKAHVFVCDISIVNSGSPGRPTPNPNVLIELGYALKTLGNTRVLLVQNTSFGSPEWLPFDLRMKRVITYSLMPNDSEKASERKSLERKLIEALKSIFSSLEKVQPIEEGPSLEEQVIDALENIRPNRSNLVRKFMTSVMEKLEQTAPVFTEEADREELLLASLAESIEIVAQYSRVVDVIATTQAKEEAKIICRGFERIVGHYNPPRYYSGVINESDGDFYRFLGHELFSTLIALLLREDHLELIGEVLKEELYVENIDPSNGPSASFQAIYDPVRLLYYRKNRLQLDRVSLHADLLHQRHTSPPLSSIAPFDLFMDADFFLFMRNSEWFPWSFIYHTHTPPRYLVKATNRKYAERLLFALDLPDINAMRERLMACRQAYQERILRIGGIPSRGFDINLNNLGSK